VHRTPLLHKAEFDGAKIKKDYKRYLQYQYYGHSDEKIPVFGLVSENVHTQYASETSADYCNSKKGCFRDTKGATNRAPLVDTHESKP
jgi:hypothetical protein